MKKAHPFVTRQNILLPHIMGKQYAKKSIGIGACSVGQLQVLTSEKPMIKVPAT